ncbi:MAG: amino acid adenylation domain-containing protein, partial [Sphaerospermopsis kisseleviana]
PPIGRPIANVQTYILDENLRPVPIGVPGELHIGGNGLARGYLNRPELTQEKFIANPFKNGKKLYKTGDLARYLADGNIEYIGRIDNQVKIRGFRIELGEIEAVLNQHPQIQTSCVIVREDNPGQKQLVSYLIPHQHSTVTMSEMRQYLKETLPEYMVPHSFVTLETLPITPNGKIDRRALPAPETRTGLEIKIVPPRNQTEKILAQIWAEVLRTKQIGINDNFFELGGDSILSIQILAKAKQAGLQLTAKQLFANQTIAELAAIAPNIKTIEIEQELVTGKLPLTPIQHWFFEQNFTQPHHFNQAFLLSVPSDIKPEPLKQAFQQLLTHHDALRLSFSQKNSNWEQTYTAPKDQIAFREIDLSTIPEHKQPEAIEAQGNLLQANLDISENLIQVALFHLGRGKRARLQITIHHLAIDGVSWRILLEDLQTAYQQLEQGKIIQLPAKTTSFKDWSEKLTAYAQSQTLKSEAAYWLNETRAAVPSISVDHTKGENTVAAANTVLLSLSEAETHALLQEVPKAYNTQINDVLLTALALVLSKWTNSKNVLFNLEGHGREDIVDSVDLSRTIGWFTTIFPVVVELPTTENLGETLKTVKEQLRAIPNKGIGYGLLHYLRQDPEIATQLKTLPQAEISFNYLGQFDQQINTTSWMQPASESAGRMHGLQNNRPHLLDINSMIVEKQLQIEWTYSTNFHQAATIEKLAQEFVNTLQDIITHCASGKNGGYTPSDFPLVKLNQVELDQLLASLDTCVERSRNKTNKTNWRNIENIYPLSPMQQGMLFESLYAPDSQVYFEQSIYNLSGQLNLRAFEKAWQQVVARHSILRTAFIWEQLAEPVQIVYRQVDVKIESEDWQHLSTQAAQEKLEVLVQSQRKQGFQLSTAPLMQLSVIQLSADSYQFVWNFHHLLLDGWSVPLLFQDLLYFYQAIIKGENPTLPAVLSYDKYIAWLQQQDLSKAEEFWREKLQGFTAPTPLTVDKLSSKGKQLDSSYREQKIQLTREETSRLQTFTRKHQLTMNNLVQGVWSLLLSRYSQESDVVFGATVSGRPPSLIGVESMVGLFINSLPVRVKTCAETEVLALLKELQIQQVESEQYSYSSLADIQRLSDVPGGSSLFESLVVFENYPVSEAAEKNNYGFSIDSVQGIEQTNYPLTVGVIPGQELLVIISYDTSRFDDAAICRLLGHFQTLLSGIVADPQQRISQLPILTETEQHQLLVEWNDTQVEYPVDKCIHELFEEQVEKTPNAIAVVFENEQLTYQQLNSRANQLAHHLQSLGVKPETLVGICVERSLEMVIGLLGILKAGGAYVPLDPEYPTERLSFMLEDAQVSVLLTQKSLLNQLPLDNREKPYQVICLEQLVLSEVEVNTFNLELTENPNHQNQPENLAYVIYTSGSTGKPKGVTIEHRAIVNLSLTWAKTFQVQNHSRLLQFGSFSFDLSVGEITTALVTGACLYLGNKVTLLPSQSLVDFLTVNKITHSFLSPSALSVLPKAKLPDLQCITVGGEACTTELVNQWGTERKFYNCYGPTESTVTATIFHCQPNGKKPAIGKAISNIRTYILDKNNQLLPPGIPGELCIAGVGLARGYLNRPQATGEKFIEIDINGQVERIYKTGDLARYLADGNIEYLGRIDNQVKIRGFRIELGEIEAVLNQHPQIQTSCVIVREDNPTEKRLVGYIVPKKDTTPELTAIRQFLVNKLPGYTIPSALVRLENLPQTPNGKIDRRALPKPELDSTIVEKYVAARTPIEELLTQIWLQVLKVESVGVNDNFFELGGHSLLAVKLLNHIQKVFNQKLALSSLFHNPTIAELALQISDHEVQQCHPHLLTLQAQGSATPIFCLPGNNGHGFYFKDLAINLENHPVYSLETPGRNGFGEVTESVELHGSQLIDLLREQQPHGPYILAGYSAGSVVAFEMAYQLEKQGEKVELLAILDAGLVIHPEDLTKKTDTDWMWELLLYIEDVEGISLGLDYADLAAQPDELARWNLAAEYLYKHDVLPENSSLSLLKTNMQVMKQMAINYYNYRPSHQISAPIGLFRAEEVDEVGLKQLRAISNYDLPDWGWQDWTEDSVKVISVPGNHLRMLYEPNVKTLASHLRRMIT